MGPDPVGGVLLTGGSSRRMGRDKAELVVAGERLADHGSRVLRAVCGERTVEVGPGSTSLASVREDPPGSGPLAALLAGAEALRARGHTGSVLLVAVDLPFVEPPLLELLAAHPGIGVVVPIAGDRRQPCCARYDEPAIGVASALLRDGARSLTALLEASDVHDVAESAWRAVAPPHALEDLDTPQDVERWTVETER